MGVLATMQVQNSLAWIGKEKIGIDSCHQLVPKCHLLLLDQDTVVHQTQDGFMDFTQPSQEKLLMHRFASQSFTMAVTIHAGRGSRLGSSTVELFSYMNYQMDLHVVTKEHAIVPFETNLMFD